jgi:hypothetical protein
MDKVQERERLTIAIAGSEQTATVPLMVFMFTLYRRQRLRASFRQC